MIDVPAHQWIWDLKEGDLFELPGLLPGLDTREPVVFKVLEVTDDPPKGLLRRVSVHVYYHDVFLSAGKASFFNLQENPTWSFK